MKVLTISVAAYNIEKYIDQLMDSILKIKQIDKIEVLIINDGSKDATLEKAQAYEKQYPTIVKAIDKKNGGHGSTINKGIELASGKYFRALDGDDWLNSQDVDILLDQLEKIDSDIVFTNYQECYEDNTIIPRKMNGLEDGKTYSFEEAAPIIQRMKYHNVIFKTEILKKNHIRLDEHCFYVDTELMLFPIPYIQTITYYDLIVYCYRLGYEGQSVSVESRIKNIEDSQKVAYRLMDFYKQVYSLSEEKRTFIENGICIHFIWYFKGLLFCSPNKIRKEELITFDKDIYYFSKEIYKQMENKDKYTVNAKLVKFMRSTHFYCYDMYGKLRNVKKITKKK